MDKDDPRLATDNSFLADFRWKWSKWFASSADWDHDHCEFCGAKFMAAIGEDVLQEGYTTQDAYYWICNVCFDEFDELYHWKREDA